MQILPLILSGGSGTRMWPLSRASLPKQFLSLYGEDTLFQQTAMRLEGVHQALPPLIVTNTEQRFLVAEQLIEKAITASGIILEPVGRNTAPAAAIGALWALQTYGDVLLLVLPSDHVVTNPVRFQQVVKDAARLASDGWLVTFGIEPTSPHTGYGYIRRGAPTPLASGHAVDAFVEKPDLARASAYLATGDYFWNSGMLLLRASTYLQELDRLQPEMLRLCRLSLELATRDADFIRLDHESFKGCPSDSIDYAVLEHTQKAAVLGAGELGWSDIGSWSALSEILPQDEAGNNLLGNVLVEDARRCYLRAGKRLIAVLGVEDLVVVDTQDATLITRKDRSQDVKKLVDRLADRALR